MKKDKEQLKKEIMAVLVEKMQSKDFENLHKKFDAILLSLNKKWDNQIVKNLNLPSTVVFDGFDDFKKDFSGAFADLKKAVEGNKVSLPKLFDVKVAKPDWYKAAPDEVTIKNKEFIVSTNIKQRKEDVSILTTLLGTFFTNLVDFLAKLQKLTYTVRMIPEHYKTPQAVILINPETMKSMDLHKLGIGTLQQTINQSMAGRASDVGIKGANTIGDGTATVTTAGTRVQLPSVPCSRVRIQAHPNNSGDMVVGGANVIAASGTRRGLALFSSQWAEFSVNDLSKLYIDSTASGDKINYIYEYVS